MVENDRLIQSPHSINVVSDLSFMNRNQIIDKKDKVKCTVDRELQNQHATR